MPKGKDEGENRFLCAVFSGETEEGKKKGRNRTDHSYPWRGGGGRSPPPSTHFLFSNVRTF